MKKIIFFLITLSLIFSSCEKGKTYRLFVGGFTKPGEKGMNVFDFNDKTGELSFITQGDVGPNPSYFCFSKKNNLIYVANEVMEFNGTFGGGLTAYKYDDENSSFEKQKEMLIPYGGPCFISMSPDSSYLFLANYPNGSVVVVKLNDNGIPESITDTILYVKSEPDVSHAHMIKNDPSGKMIYVTDLGQNRIFRYDFNTEKGTLTSIDTLRVPDGFGPRHFDFSSDGSKLYVINELGSKITVFSPGDKPALIQTLPTVREGFNAGNYCADLHLSHDGKYVYGSNRGENTIVTFEVEPDGTLKLAGHTTCGGDWPRNFTLDPSGKFLLVGNQKSDSLAIFRLNSKTGMPSEPPRKYKVIAPACLKFY
ncbi:MAG TPA: lactonase family protein [Bacteroidales bacterium]|nr:lactonase family protein [Bacteroidales bacterium]